MIQVRTAAAALLAAALLGGCARHARTDTGPPPLNVEAARAIQRDIATYITLDGQVAPLQEATLSIQQPGQLAAVYVTEGQRVSAGQLLAKVDDSTLRAQLAQAEAQINQAAARAQGSALNVPIAANQLSGAVVTAQQQANQARTSLASAQAAYENARLVYNSNQQLFRQGYVSRSALEQARSQYVAAQSQLNSARAAITQSETAIRTARGNTAQTGVNTQEVAANRAAVSAAQAQANILQTEIAQTAAYAPFDGVVTARLLDPGAMAGPSQPVVRVSQLGMVYINASVPDAQLAYVHSGTPVTFTSPSLPGKTFSGRISDVNAVPSQGTLSYRARIRQANPGSLLRGGMLVTVTVRKEFHRAAIVVPRSAVYEGEAGADVFTVTGKKARQVPVRLGLQTDTLSEVHSPLVHPGTLVITTRPDALQNGSVIAIANRPAGRSPH